MRQADTVSRRKVGRNGYAPAHHHRRMGVSGQCLLDKMQAVLPPEHLIADKERGCAEHAARHGFFGGFAQRLLDVVILHQLHHQRGRDTGGFQYGRQLVQVTQVARVLEHRAEDGGLVEDPGESRRDGLQQASVAGRSQDRAEAVRRALSLQGVSEAQLEAVSFGKEKPAATGGSEDAYAKNRRVEITYR